MGTIAGCLAARMSADYANRIVDSARASLVAADQRCLSYNKALADGQAREGALVAMLAKAEDKVKTSRKTADGAVAQMIEYRAQRGRLRIKLTVATSENRRLQWALDDARRQLAESKLSLGQRLSNLLTGWRL